MGRVLKEVAPESLLFLALPQSYGITPGDSFSLARATSADVDIFTFSCRRQGGWREEVVVVVVVVVVEIRAFIRFCVPILRTE